MSSTQKPTSIFQNTRVQKLAEHKQMQFNTWSLIGVLIAAFFILKTFVYIKDAKRHGK